LRSRLTSIWLTRTTVLKVRKRLPFSLGKEGASESAPTTGLASRAALPAIIADFRKERRLRLASRFVTTERVAFCASRLNSFQGK
jgi:hypothetical protein